MDLSKLSQNEKLATYGSLAVIVGALVGLGAAGLGFLAVLAALGMLVVVFLPQMSPATQLPGSHGSLMVALGAVAAVILVLGFLAVLSALGVLLQLAFVSTLFYLLAVAGGLLMAWAGWQEFQAEGGRFQVGAAPSGGSAATSTPPPPSVEHSSESSRGSARSAGAAVDRDREDRPTA